MTDMKGGSLFLPSRLFLMKGSFRSHFETLPILIIMVLGIGLSSCSSPSPEKVVGERTLERWQALIHRDLDKAYGYLSPGYRAVNSLKLYKARIGKAVQWEDATLKKVSCTDKSCEVTVSIHYRFAGPSGKHEGDRLLNETWTLADDQWWFLPKD